MKETNYKKEEKTDRQTNKQIILMKRTKQWQKKNKNETA